MAATITDKFKKTYNAANPNVARVTASRATLGATLTCDNLSGWPTDTAVDFSTYKVDSSNEVIAGTQIDWKGIVSGNNIGSLTRITGASDSGSAIGDVVEMNPTGNWANDLMTGILTHADQDGTLKAGAVDTAAVLASNVVTTVKVLDGAITPPKWTNPYKFSAYCSAGKGVSSTSLIVDLQTELFDTNNNFASSRYTAPVAGFYQINAQAWWGSAGASVTEYASVHLRKNGSATGMPESDRSNGSGNGDKYIRPQINCLIQLAAGDYIEFWITVVGNRDLVAGQSTTYMNGFLVSET